MQRIFREALFYLLVFAFVALAMSAASFWYLQPTYAGVTDDGAVQAGVTAHAAYLKAVGAAVGRVLAIEIPALATLSFGILALGRTTLRSPTPSGVPQGLTPSGVPPLRVFRSGSQGLTPSGVPQGRRRGRRGDEGRPRMGSNLPRFVAVASLVLVVWLGAEARRHPGLFLGLLSASPVAPMWVTFARFMWPLLIAAAAAGWVRLAVSAESTSVRIFAATGALFAMGWFWLLEIEPAERKPGGVAGASPSRPVRARPNVLLIGVDSLRPDKIDERATPALAKLCRESIYFPNALVTLPRTAPSWVALLTSLPPLASGVETMFPSAKRSRLSGLAMPAHLASLGYATSVASEYAGEFFDRVELGFERRSVPRVELEQILGQALLGRQPFGLAMAGQLYARLTFTRSLLPAPIPELLRGFASFSHPSVLAGELVERIAPDWPWFALVFYSQPHFPYTSSSPFYERYAVRGANPALRYGKDVTRGEVRTEVDRAQIEGLYRGALAETDRAVGELFARLDASGELDDTIVILTADHGEGLYECPACVGHGDNLTGMSTLKVPLAIRLPRARFPVAAPAEYPAFVSQLDVYPTMLSLLGVAPLPIHEGRALLAPDGAALPLPANRVFFAESGEWLWPTPAVPSERIDYPPITTLAAVERDRIVIEERFLPVIRAAKHRVAFRPPFKLVYRPTPKGVVWSLHDVDRDPFETEDLAAALPEIMTELRSELVRSVLRFAHIVPAGDFFLTRPPPPPEEYY